MHIKKNRLINYVLYIDDIYIYIYPSLCARARARVYTYLHT